ncbi:MAG: hypothetical protein JNM67_02475 [Bacteroidetes bacterium]|nr:hypothetical protein [Bacteroidota bacterium]
MKNTFSLLLLMFILNSLSAEMNDSTAMPSSTHVPPLKVVVWGEYVGRDSETGRPICNPHQWKACILQRYIHDGVSIFPLGIQSAEYEDPDNPGTWISMSSIDQTVNGSSQYVFTFGTSATWTGPFNLISGTWSIIP